MLCITILNSLTAKIYPSGKRVGYEYGGYGRVVTLLDDENALAEYAYSGSGTALRTKYVEPDLTLDYTPSGALDRFGRIADHAWKNGSGENIVRIRHSYDLSGNRLNRQDMANSTWSETYGYDEMNQIASMRRTGHAESWQYDETGNWMRYEKNNVVENRSHNAANEVLTGAVHDANGNMTRMPGLKGKYDAWNRLVEVGDIAQYRYDGRNFRIERIVGATSTKSFFNLNWQEVESRTDGVITTYAWGLRYIDDLIYREKGSERLYSLADPNWNAVAIVDKAATVRERFHYDAFGKVSGLTSDWNRTFTGQVLDAETGLMLYRNRFYHVGLGRFISRDPISYSSRDTNLFRYVKNASMRHADYKGLALDAYEMSRACEDFAVSDFREDGNVNNAQGYVLCQHGEMVPCVNQNPGRWPSNHQARQLAKACSTVHEMTHMYLHANPCEPCGVHEIESDIFYTYVEMEAYAVQAACLWAAYFLCTTDECRVQIDASYNDAVDGIEGCSDMHTWEEEQLGLPIGRDGIDIDRNIY